jgi:predicted ribosomally synthesized peptide with SipW-like signal peptide
LKVRRQTNLLLGLVVFGIALVILLRALNVIPDGVYDLMLRASPALLVLFGLSIFLRGRVPMGSLLALILSVALVAGVTYAAFNQRATQQRTDLQEDIEQPLPADLTLLRVRIQTLATDVNIVRAPEGETTISGRFVGSTESRITAELVENGDTTANFTLTEDRPSPFPLLEAMGRGTLTISLPAGVLLDVDFRGEQGAVTLNMDGTSLERMNVNLLSGNALVSLPAYDPLGTDENANLGTLAVGDGAITIVVPNEVGGRFELNRAGSGLRPVYPETYLYLDGDILEARGIEDSAIIMQYAVTAPRGQITLQVRDASG